jgi:hypothetical protein
VEGSRRPKEGILAMIPESDRFFELRGEAKRWREEEENRGVQRGLSKGVQKGRRPPALRAGNP